VTERVQLQRNEDSPVNLTCVGGAFQHLQLKREPICISAPCCNKKAIKGHILKECENGERKEIIGNSWE